MAGAAKWSDRSENEPASARETADRLGERLHFMRSASAPPHALPRLSGLMRAARLMPWLMAVRFRMKGGVWLDAVVDERPDLHLGHSAIFHPRLIIKHPYGGCLFSSIPTIVSFTPPASRCWWWVRLESFFSHSNHTHTKNIAILRNIEGVTWLLPRSPRELDINRREAKRSICYCKKWGGEKKINRETF